jgi:putative transcriptional regulator
MKNKIKKYRLKKKLTQAELAKKIGKSQICISLYETGRRKPDIYVAVKIAKALETTLDSIFL